MEDSSRRFEILLVEDNPGHVRLMREALEESEVPNNVNVATDGVEALAFLHREGRYARVSGSDLIILDLKLPRKDGFGVLAEVKNDSNLKRIPVVVFSSSNAEQDIIKSYNLHANAYIIKPIDFDQFVAVTKSIENFWFNTVKLPPSN